MAGDEDFITIVPVGEGRPPPPERDPAFVTVLTVGAAAGAAEVLVRRPRGARLGLGLKFEGGSAAAEKVRRLLVQSCAADSPAASATTPWGKLIPGDEILAIDGAPVSDLTRIDCVRRLKDSDEALKLLVRHLEEKERTSVGNDAEPARQAGDLQRPTCHPPPVPPRKLNKKNSFKDRPNPLGDLNVKIADGFNESLGDVPGPQVNGRIVDMPASFASKLSRKSSFDSHIHRQAKESLFKKSSPEEVRRLVRRLSDGKAMPAEAEVYMDLLSAEWERCLALADAESDDTGSSISTVVDRLGSLGGSVESSIPSTPTMQPKTIDIQRVLNCIENIDSDLLKDIATTRFVEKSGDGGPNERPPSRNGLTRGLDEIDSATGGDETAARKKLVCNDKNNNNTIVRNVTCISIEASAPRQVADRCKPRAEAAAATATTAKPRPLPRSTRPEPALAAEPPAVEEMPPERAPTSESEALLTPTKKNCIESWLQRSEEELISKRSPSETTAPEALPRLIDFVPKPQYRSMETPGPIVSGKQSSSQAATAAAEEEHAAVAASGAVGDMPPLPLPPAPAESREDGSGASLDTIGELDEGTDTTNTEDSAENDKNLRNHKKFDSSFWEGHTHMSDTEDKSLSNDENPPTCPRQPPDGVETPCDAVEKAPLLRVEPSPPPLPVSTPAALRLPPRLPDPLPWPVGRIRTRTSYSRSQDARSECSVKDKIAMFSSARADSVERDDSCIAPRATLNPTRNSSAINRNTFSDVQTLDRRLTKSHENLDEVPRAERSYKHIDRRPEVLGALHTTKPRTENKEMIKSRYSDFGTMPVHYGSTTNLVALTPHSESTYHARSISDDGANGSHKSTLEYLIEQRKKSMSKLRGLMIPEAQAPIVDLPEIKVQECSAAKKLLFNSHQFNAHQNEKKTTSKTTMNLNDPWKMNLLPNNIPKYSPAFKRKSLQVYTNSSSLSKESTPERKLESPLDTRPLYGYSGNTSIIKHIPTKPPRTSIDTKKLSNDRASATLPSRIDMSSALNLASKNDKTVCDKYRGYGNVEVKICTTTDIVDSDDDSAVSSTQSSYRSSASSPLQVDSTGGGIESDSSHLSPHYISYSLVKTELPPQTNGSSKLNTRYEKRNVCRSVSSDTNVSVSSSAGSAATSGSQASCSSLESSVADSSKKKVTRTHSVDTINRRNILASAKCRSGRDLNVSSPVVETKFSHDAPDRSPSPQRKSSDRLTTLASSVSGLSNKGDARRIRSKVISDTDSDSENEVNVRQRKSEFKNSRLKKNSSSQLAKVEPTRKQPDRVMPCNDKDSVAEEVPQVISQRIIKEIKKPGLQEATSVKSVLPDTLHPKTSTTKAITAKKSSNSISNGISEVKIKIPAATSTCKTTNNESVSSQTQSIAKTIISSSNEDQTDGKPSRSYTICLKKGIGTGVGLILAGGVDCEAKAVTVHKVLAGSVAEREGLQRGVRVRSINGRSMDGLTHADTVAVLKEPRSEVTIELEDDDMRETVSSAEYGSDIAESKESDASSSAAGAVRGGGGGGSGGGGRSCVGNQQSGPVSVTLEKSGAGAGLGFGLEGGKDSPNGDHPLTIKKLFAGGAAARSGRVAVGAQLLSAGGVDMRGLTRTQAWAALKALPPGPVALCLHDPR